MVRADVLDYDLQRQLYSKLKDFKPMPACFDPKFVAGNQSARADNIIKGTKQESLEQLRQDIKYAPSSSVPCPIYFESILEIMISMDNSKYVIEFYNIY